MEKFIKGNQKGITLIALIVTIIVMVILASVTVSTLSGDHGLIKEAENAKNAAEASDEKENQILKNIIGFANELVKPSNNTAGGGGVVICKHTWDNGVTTTESTCTTEGTMLYTCTQCGTTKTESISMTEHGWVEVATEEYLQSAASCLDKAIYYKSCRNCGAKGSVTFESEEPLGHSENSGEITTQPTCTEKGVKTFKCIRCSIVMRTEEVEETGHAYEETSRVEATYTEAGKITYTCQNCNATYTEDIPMLGHTCTYDAGTITTAATCTEKGVKTFKCTVCSATKTEEIAATGHNYTSEVTKEPTYTETGIRTYTCQNCNATYTEDIPMLGHTCTYDAGTITTAATCTEKGVKTYTCTVCSATKTEEIPATGHTEENGGTETVHTKCSVCGITLSSTHSSYTESIVAAATCEATGTKKYTCTCGYSYTETIAATGHNYTSEVTKEPTYTETGIRTYTCQNCNATYTEDIPMLGHTCTYDAGTITTAATCTEKGVKTYTCTLCSATKTEEIPATGHTEENGGTETVHTKCSVCGITLSSTHSFTEEVVTAATCEATGTKKYTCTCGYSYTETIAATGHTYNQRNSNSIYEATPASCEHGTYYYFSCSCGAKGTETWEDADQLDHEFEDQTTKICCVRTSADCENDATYWYECSWCTEHSDTDYWTDEGSATGHTEVPATEELVCTKCEICGITLVENHDCEVETIEATCTETGSKKYTCKVCGWFDSEETIPATGHNYKVSVAVEAECEKAGYTTYKCETCGHEYTEEIPLLYHDWDDVGICRRCDEICDHGGLSSTGCPDCGLQTCYTEYEIHFIHVPSGCICSMCGGTYHTSLDSYGKCTGCGTQVE